MRYGTRNLLTAVRPSEGKGVGERIARLCDAAICTGMISKTEILPSANYADLNSERTERHCLGICEEAFRREDYGNLPKCFRGVSRDSSSMSASTMILTSSWKRTFGSHPRIFFALDESPIRMSTSAGRS